MYPGFPVDVLQGGRPLQGLKGGSCLTLRNELPTETQLTKQGTLLGRT